MITKVFHAVVNTHNLPVVGGATGALTQVKNVMLPSLDTIIYTICIMAIGATVGYLIKIFLDWLILKIKA